ncbi:hypothetical protein GJ496_007176 [Pomphorhynchus laevis]|nr:hypothetical protein GJ496_007176 [Pomphorhynchus laevis]
MREDDGNKPVVTKVELTLHNDFVSSDKLQPGASPSAQDGLSAEAEYDLRVIGCEYIQACGILLRLPQTAMATGTVLFHRFYYSKSFVRYNLEHLAMASINLASKIEESPRRVRDVINVFTHLKQLRSQRTIRSVILDNHYVDTKNQVIKAERRILKELGFCVYVKHPNKIIILYLRVLMMEKNRALIQMAWNYMNDSLLTDIFLRYTPESIACACILLAARKLNIALPRNPPWHLLFGAQYPDIESICKRIIILYQHEIKPYTYYEGILAELKENQDTLRRINREKCNLIPTDTFINKGNDQQQEQNIILPSSSYVIDSTSTDTKCNLEKDSKNEKGASSCPDRQQLPSVSRKRPLPFAPSGAVQTTERRRLNSKHHPRNHRHNRRSVSYSDDDSNDTSSSYDSCERHRHRHHHNNRKHKNSLSHRPHNSTHHSSHRRSMRYSQHYRTSRHHMPFISDEISPRSSISKKVHNDLPKRKQRHSTTDSSQLCSPSQNAAECHHKRDNGCNKEASSSEERFLRMQLIKQAVKSMDERVGNEVLRAERIRRFKQNALDLSESDKKHKIAISNSKIETTDKSPYDASSSSPYKKNRSRERRKPRLRSAISRSDIDKQHHSHYSTKHHHHKRQHRRSTSRTVRRVDSTNRQRRLHFQFQNVTFDVVIDTFSMIIDTLKR